MCMGANGGGRARATVRFDAVLVPKELREIVLEFPELTSFTPDMGISTVRIHDRGFAGCRNILSDVSIEALAEKLVPMIPEIGDREGRSILIIQRHGYCLTCQGSKDPCMHLGSEVACVNEVHGWVDWDRILQPS